jgi:hypothetical protein
VSTIKESAGIALFPLLQHTLAEQPVHEHPGESDGVGDGLLPGLGIEVEEVLAGHALHRGEQLGERLTNGGKSDYLTTPEEGVLVEHRLARCHHNLWRCFERYPHRRCSLLPQERIWYNRSRGQCSIPREPMNKERPPCWHHVTPLFLLPSILQSGGIQCGADAEVAGLPRRSSSRGEDDLPLKELGDKRPSDCILLFTTPKPSLLKDKLAKTRKQGAVWRSFPHVVVSVCAGECLKAAKYTMFGCPVNVGRAIRNGDTTKIRRFRSYIDAQNSKFQELLIPADSLDGRTLPLSAVRGIRCFSSADKRLVQSHLQHTGHKIDVHLDEEPRYVEGQSQAPGDGFFSLTQELYQATWSGEHAKVKSLLDSLACTCFD